jgi:hypothetical protein
MWIWGKKLYLNQKFLIDQWSNNLQSTIFCYRNSRYKGFGCGGSDCPRFETLQMSAMAWTTFFNVLGQQCILWLNRLVPHLFNGQSRSHFLLVYKIKLDVHICQVASFPFFMYILQQGHLTRWYARPMLGGSLSVQHGTSSSYGWRNSLQLWRLVANILNKQLRSNDKGWSSILGVGRGANNPSP